MPILSTSDLISLNSQQIESLQKITDRIGVAVDTGGALAAITRTDLQFFDTEEEEALRKLFARIYPTGYLTWAAQRAAAGAELQDAFQTNQVRDLLNAMDEFALYLTTVD